MIQRLALASGASRYSCRRTTAAVASHQKADRGYLNIFTHPTSNTLFKTGPQSAEHNESSVNIPFHVPTMDKWTLRNRSRL
ncbi:hypothetical protein KCP74_05780 [Salmonella enterica subsp. enterica]|nr:hypothetical protein KCP74_05780 [Salmonella enterica subsp. enterica]